MLGPQFFQTVIGKKFYEADIPRIIEALEGISKELKRANDLQEKKLQLENEKKDKEVENN